MKYHCILLVILCLNWYVRTLAQTSSVNKTPFPEMIQEMERRSISVPEVPGYKVLKADLHIHTVFSDGDVWPSFRVNEAWMEGLDVLAITDHLEHMPKKAYLGEDANVSFDIAKVRADQLGILLIKGTEITRDVPFGHINALFITDANAMKKSEPLDAAEEAIRQGGVLVWNHPGWYTDSCMMYNVQEKLIKQKKIVGLEVFNHYNFYPRAMRWIKQYGIAPLACTDLHWPSAQTYKLDSYYRPITLIFVKEVSLDGVKEALTNGKTIAWFNGKLAGESELVSKLFSASLSVSYRYSTKTSDYYAITNSSDIPYVVRTVNGDCTFAPQSTVLFRVKSGVSIVEGKIMNVFVGEEECLAFKLSLK